MLSTAFLSLSALLYAGALLARWVPPADGWLFGLLALAFPWLWLLQTALLRRHRRTGALALLPGAVLLPAYLNWHPQRAGSLRLVTCNLNYLGATLAHPDVGAAVSAASAELRALQPDLLLAQDATSDTQRRNQTLASLLQYPFAQWSAASLASFSRLPLSHAGSRRFPESNNGFAWFDVQHQGRSFRLFNVHLQSYAFGSWRRIPQRLPAGLRARSLEADEVAQAVAASPLPCVVCGDFNDVPASYAVHRISAGLTDGFRAAGRGLAVTYRGPLPAGRIDYVFCSPELEFTGYRHLRSPAFDDHLWVCADLRWRPATGESTPD